MEKIKHSALVFRAFAPSNKDVSMKRLLIFYVISYVFSCLFGLAISYAADTKKPPILLVKEPSATISNSTSPKNQAPFKQAELFPPEPHFGIVDTFKSSKAYWALSGTVSNESNEQYHYFFQIHRENSKFRSLATVIHAESQEIVLFEENDAIIQTDEENQWRVGNTFIKLNPINNSLVFGLKTKHKTGFNFKVDLLNPSYRHLQGEKPVELQKGIHAVINLVGHLNGHIQLPINKKTSYISEPEEQFVTGKSAWFRQIWGNNLLEHTYSFQGILCQFNQGDGFYALNSPNKDAIRGAMAGWRTIEGDKLKMSQFVKATETKLNQWSIQLNQPKKALIFNNILNEPNQTVINQNIALGRLTDKTGFCIVNKDYVG